MFFDCGELRLPRVACHPRTPFRTAFFRQKKRHAVACRTLLTKEPTSTYWPYLALASATHLSLAAPVNGSHFSRATL